MPLKITVKSFEALHIGTATVTVRTEGYTLIEIEGDLPVLRGDDYVEPGGNPDIYTQLYVLLQEAYLLNDFDYRKDEYFSLLGTLLEQDPAARAIIEDINRWLAVSNPYKALKAAGRLLGKR